VFNSITGTVTGKGAGKFTLETGQVEWEVEASATTVQALPPAGERTRVFTYLHHREDVLKLYGFATEAERAVFFDLQKVDGIGPRQALRILSGTRVERLAEMLEAGDVKSLTSIPGLGVKTAQKMILALKGKLSLAGAEDEVPGEGADIVNALADMGFDGRKAAAVVRDLSVELKGSVNGADFEKELFRQAIVRLSSD
jgi:holliday junction DNA helicase RuvA